MKRPSQTSCPRRSTGFLAPLLVPALLLAPAATLCAQVLDQVKIGLGEGGFSATYGVNDRFGSGVAALGDLDGDGVGDLAVSKAYTFENAGPADSGVVWILFMNADGTVRSQQPIGTGLGGFGGALLYEDGFGDSLAALGDVDGDGVTDIAVGATGDVVAYGGFNRGAVWIIFLNADGTAKAWNKIAEDTGGFVGTFGSGTQFGSAVCSIGDTDNDGVPDIAVGAPGNSDVLKAGSVWLLRLNADGTVKAQHQISELGEMSGLLGDYDNFGSAVCDLGDFDGDGVRDLAVGAVGTESPVLHTPTGAVWLLFLHADLTVKSVLKLNETTGLQGALETSDGFGSSIANLGDISGDGVTDLAVGASKYNGPLPTPPARGAVFLIYLMADGTVGLHETIALGEGGFFQNLPAQADFGAAIAFPGDADGDGSADIFVGSPGNFVHTGYAWLIFLRTYAWASLGGGVAGGAGALMLTGVGTLQGGTPMTLSMQGGKANAPMTLFVGPSNLSAPFKGGTLVPLPVWLIPASTNALGEATFAATWPAGIPAGQQVFLQCWMKDPAGPAGFAASNGLMGTQP